MPAHTAVQEEQPSSDFLEPCTMCITSFAEEFGNRSLLWKHLQKDRSTWEPPEPADEEHAPNVWNKKRDFIFENKRKSLNFLAIFLVKLFANL